MAERPRDHVWFIFTVHCFLSKLSSFELVSKVRIFFHFSYLSTDFFQENKDANLTLAINAIQDLTLSLTVDWGNELF